MFSPFQWNLQHDTACSNLCSGVTWEPCSWMDSLGTRHQRHMPVSPVLRRLREVATLDFIARTGKSVSNKTSTFDFKSSGPRFEPVGGGLSCANCTTLKSVRKLSANLRGGHREPPRDSRARSTCNGFGRSSPTRGDGGRSGLGRGASW